MTWCTSILAIFIILLFSLPVSAADLLPVAAFSATRTSGTTPLNVTFIDASGNSPTAWFWTFGDGSSSTEQNPAHTYTDAGTYTVSLTATNSAGNDTVTRNDFITVSKVSPPVASFALDNTSGTAPLTITFTDTSANSPTTWVWTFGDGSYSTSENPAHTYVAGEPYTITLTVTNSGGTDTVTKTDYITVSAVQEPVASFTSNITTGIVPLAVEFTDTSSNSPTTWEWSFGDGSYSTSENPTHSYNEDGNYSVTLTAINYGGSDTITKIDYITVEAPEEPVVSFTSNVTYGTAPLTVAFTDTSANSPTYWKWTFGDGDVSYLENPEHSYTEVGDYTVTLTVTNDAGSDTVTETSCIKVESEPVASFTSDLTTGTAPLAVTFTDTSTNSPTYWKWTFGDGDVSYLENPTHTYTSSGYYTVTLTTSNDAGSDRVTKSLYITVIAADTTVAETYTTVATKIATTKTTPPVTIAPASEITTAATDSATDELSLMSLIVPGGIALVAISIVVLILVIRGRNRPPKWDL